MSLWAEIKQRRITQIVIAYLAAGFMVLTVIDQVVDREVLPLVIYEVALTLYLFGIVFALVIGWYHGERGEQQAPWQEIVILSIVGVVGLSTAAMVIRQDMTETTLTDAVDSGALARIAVLYLDDGSLDGSARPVADAITEGLITQLAPVEGLEVRSRNASRRVSDLTVDEHYDSIASYLEVGTLIDGSVQQRGDDYVIRIRASEARNGVQLFAETYTWAAEEAATIPTSLSERVAEQLRERLGLEIRLRTGQAEAPTPAAWLQLARAERYLKDAGEAVRAGDPHSTAEAFDAAHAELEAATAGAPEWAEPWVLRSQVAYEEYILAQSQDELFEMMERSIDFADRALELDELHAGAFEWRGTARYRRWLFRLPTEGPAEEMLRSAESDLRRAVQLDRSRAGAYSTLSHLANQVDDPTGTMLAAQRAYEADAFLDVIDGVLWRLFAAAYDEGQHGPAERWCLEGRDRFPQDFRFVQCQIVGATMPVVEPDISGLWELHGELLPLLTETPEFFDAQARVAIAGVIGRAGLPDSADAVFDAARVGDDIDPEGELTSFEAAMRSLMGDTEGAIGLLERFVIGNEERAPGEHWWWDNIDGDPRFQRIRATH